MELIPDPPSYSAIRSILRILEEKGYVAHLRRGRRYVFHPAVSREQAKRSALIHLLKTFFNDSPESVVAALMDVKKNELTDEVLERLTTLIDESRGGEEGS